MISLNEYFETASTKKDGAWADRIVTYMREHMQPLVSDKVYKDNMDLIMSTDDLSEIRKMFKDPNALGFEIIPLIIIEKIRNILIGERTKAGVHVNVEATDATSQVERENDKELLRHRGELEALITFLNQGIGLPAFKLADEKGEDGSRPYAGNIEMFDQLGLDDTSEYETAYFFEVWHKLMHEVDAQQVINSVISYNELHKKLEYWVNEILAVKCIATRHHVNQVNGAIEIHDIRPNKVQHIPGQRDDGKDAVCIGFEEEVSIIDLVRMLGAEIDIEEEMFYLMNAINTAKRTDFVGILWSDGSKTDYIRHNGTGPASYCGINQFMEFKLTLGYIEWKSIDAKTTKEGTDWHGNSRSYFTDNRDVSEVSSYTKNNYYEQNTYKSYYLPTSTGSQRLYKFGRVFHQIIEGAEDEYSSYTISYKKLPGPTVADIARPFIKIAQETFAKFRWFVRRAKPKGRAFNYHSLLQMAKKMYAKADAASGIQNVIKIYEEGINEIFMPPTGAGGEILGGGQNPNYEVPNGLDPTAITFKAIIEWAVLQTAEGIGLNNNRLAVSPEQNEGYRINENATEQSRTGTEYINVMLDDVMENSAKYLMLATQDILNFRSSLAYKWLVNLIGNPPLNRLSRLKNVAIHRYGLVINSYSSFMERQAIKRNTEIAYQRGEITFDAMMLINSIKDPKKANYIMAFEKKRAEKEKQKELKYASDLRIQEDTTRTQNQIKIENAKGYWWTQRENARGYWNLIAAKENNNNKKELTEAKLEAKPDEMALKAQENIRVNAAKENAKLQHPLNPAVTSPNV